MALAETPEQVNERRRRLEEGNTNPQPATDDSEEGADPFADSELSAGLRQGVSKHGDARDRSHPATRELRMVMRGWNTRGYVKVLSILEVVCSTDRMFEKARKQVLDVMNGQEREMVEILNRLAGPPLVKDKEKGNG